MYKEFNQYSNNCQCCINTFLAFIDMDVAANNDRVRIEPYDPTVTTWSIETYCSPNTEPGLEEYNVIVKQGYNKHFL